MRTINLFRNNTFFKYLFGLGILALAVLTILPDSTETGPTIPHLTESGFFLHLFAYLILTILGYFAYPHRKFIIFSFVSLYSVFMEIVQIFIPYRSFNYWDIVANFTGILLFVLCLALFKYQQLRVKRGIDYDQ